MTGEWPTRLHVVGDASVDYFVRVPHLATADGKAIGTLVGIHGGGMSANLAAAATLAGVEVTLVTRVGGDEDGRSALDALATLGVNVAQSIIEEDARTWLCFVQLDSTGEKALVGADTGIKVPDASDAQTPEDVPSIVAPLADDPAWAATVATEARAQGHRIAIDLEPDAVRNGDPNFRRLLDAADIVMMNSAAARRMGGRVAAIETLVAHGVSLIVISAGAEGATAWTADGHVLHAHAAGRVDVVDTTGAGDALAGALLGTLAAGRPLSDALAAGVRAATRCVSHLGGRSYLLQPVAPFIHVIQTEEQEHP